MESVLWSVWNDFSLVLTPSLPAPPFLTLFQKYIQNMVKNVNYQWVLPNSPTEVY